MVCFCWSPHLYSCGEGWWFCPEFCRIPDIIDEMSLSIISLGKRQAENKAPISDGVDRAEPQFSHSSEGWSSTNQQNTWKKERKRKKEESTRRFLGIIGHFPRAVLQSFRSKWREWNEIPGSFELMGEGQRKALESKCQVVENVDLQNRNQKNLNPFQASFQPQLSYFIVQLFIYLFIYF